MAYHVEDEADEDLDVCEDCGELLEDCVCEEEDDEEEDAVL